MSLACPEANRTGGSKRRGERPRGIHGVRTPYKVQRRAQVLELDYLVGTNCGSKTLLTIHTTPLVARTPWQLAVDWLICGPLRSS